jgi:hypothetical protein
VCSVRGLHRAFPPSDPPVYSRPQLKPPCAICCFTTTTFGAHRGADQGAGRSRSERDLLRLLGGSTSAQPPCTAGLLQLGGLTSTRPGQHTAVPDLHQHLRAGTQLPRAGIFMSRLAYSCPVQHMCVWCRFQHCPGRHITSPAGICFFLASIHICGPALASSGLFWPT